MVANGDLSSECLRSVNKPCTGKDCCTGMFPVSCTVLVTQETVSEISSGDMY